MTWVVEYVDAFELWWDTLNELEQESIASVVGLLETFGPNLKYPYSAGINMAKFSHMRELRIQHKGKPYRILYAFDPRRVAVLLVGGEKTGKDDWYDKFIPVAEQLYQAHLITLQEEET